MKKLRLCIHKKRRTKSPQILNSGKGAKVPDLVTSRVDYAGPHGNRTLMEKELTAETKEPETRPVIVGKEDGREVRDPFSRRRDKANSGKKLSAP